MENAWSGRRRSSLCLLACSSAFEPPVSRRIVSYRGWCLACSGGSVVLAVPAAFRCLPAYLPAGLLVRSTCSSGLGLVVHLHYGR